MAVLALLMTAGLLVDAGDRSVQKPGAKQEDREAAAKKRRERMKQRDKEVDRLLKAKLLASKAGPKR